MTAPAGKKVVGWAARLPTTLAVGALVDTSWYIKIIMRTMRGLDECFLDIDSHVSNSY